MTVAPQELIYWVGMAAVAVTTATAVLETEDKGMDLVGAVIVGLAAGLGGGTLRDLLLARQAFWLGDPAYLVCGLFAVGITFIVARRVRLPAGVFVIPDAVGLALFTVVGTRIGLEFSVPWLAASLLGRARSTPRPRGAARWPSSGSPRSAAARPWPWRPAGWSCSPCAWPPSATGCSCRPSIRATRTTEHPDDGAQQKSRLATSSRPSRSP
jgi:hypothetical protein